MTQTRTEGRRSISSAPSRRRGTPSASSRPPPTTAGPRLPGTARPRASQTRRPRVWPTGPGSGGPRRGGRPAAQARLVLERLHRAHTRRHHQRQRLPAHRHFTIAQDSGDGCSWDGVCAAEELVVRDLWLERTGRFIRGRAGNRRGNGGG
jgi:hypothetical protein